jgi:hypothetical protein
MATELQQMIEMVAKDKGIEPSIVVSAIEDAYLADAGWHGFLRPALAQGVERPAEGGVARASRSDQRDHQEPPIPAPGCAEPEPREPAEDGYECHRHRSGAGEGRQRAGQEFGLDGTHGSPTPGGSARIGMEDIPTPKALPGKILGHHHPWCAESVTPLDRPRPHGGSCTPHAA